MTEEAVDELGKEGGELRFWWFQIFGSQGRIVLEFLEVPIMALIPYYYIIMVYDFESKIDLLSH